ncbi:MAG: Rpn family recombination-promoting nuclease/putative transposase, partial [Candidatus Eremiobacterota bacterium]
MCKINPRVDFAFKLIFGNEQNKDILISLLNAILEDYQAYPIESIEILNPLGSKEYSKDKLTILDIKAKDEKGEFYNIEMQIADQYYYQKRALYYWSRLYTSQISEGIGYQNLARTVSINILNFNTIKEKDYHNIYRLKELKKNTDLTDQLEIHFIELEKFSKELPDLKRTMDRWIYFLKHAEKFTETNLPEPLKEIEPIEKANVMLDRISLNKEQ